MNLLNMLRTLETLTRPPRLGHDVDGVDSNTYSHRAIAALKDARWPFGANYDGWPQAERARAKHDAEQLADKEAEEECGECGYFCMCAVCDTETEYCEAHDIDDTCWVDDLRAHYDAKAPTPTEPSLTDVVAQLAQICYLVEDLRNLVAALLPLGMEAAQ